MNYITDFTKLKKELNENMEFRQKGGMCAAEEEGGLESTSRLLYSVYLYLDYINELTLENMKNYLLTMCKYKIFGYTYEYHAVNAARLKIENSYSKPHYYCESANIHLIPFIDNTFLAIGAICQTNGLIEKIINYFNEKTK